MKLNKSIARWLWSKLENAQDRINASRQHRQLDLSNAPAYVVGGTYVYLHNKLLLSKLGVYPSNPHAYLHTDGKIYVNLAFLTLPETQRSVMVMRETLFGGEVSRGLLFKLIGVTPESLECELSADDIVIAEGYKSILLDILRRQWVKKPTYVLKKRIENIASKKG